MMFKCFSKDIKDCNKFLLSIFGILFLFLTGLISYFFSTSFAAFNATINSYNVAVLSVGDTTNFSYSGNFETYNVPYTGYYYIELGGAKGGNTTGAGGAKTSGYIKLNAGDILYFYVGKGGSDYNTNCKTSGYEFNGGGIAKPSSTNVCGPTGGGATDVRLVSGAWDNNSSLASRIMVAGGGGGGNSSYSDYTVGVGGTLYGGKVWHSTYQNYLSNPGTQISGGAAPTMYSIAQSNGEAGSFGKGGAGGASAAIATSGGGAGGGSGYYGASGSSGLADGNFPASGGSSYISGYAGVNSITSSSSITPTNNVKHYSNNYFLGGIMMEGQNNGNGYAKIEYVGVKIAKTNTNLNNVKYIKNCISGNNLTSNNYWIEMQAIIDGENVAKNKSIHVYNSDGQEVQNPYSTRPYSWIVDGDINYINWVQAPTTDTTQCAIVDLGRKYDLDEIAEWNYFGDQIKYNDNTTYVSNTGDASDWTLLIEKNENETSNGFRYSAYVNE